MFTLESLKAIAPVKTGDHVADFMFKEQLQYAVRFMEQSKVTQILAIGNRLPEGISVPSKGEKIIIPKGTRITSMNPRHGQNHAAKRDFEITVFDSNKGWLSTPYHDPETVIEQAAGFTWPGTSGYWQTVSMRDWIEMGGVELTRTSRLRVAA